MTNKKPPLEQALNGLAFLDALDAPAAKLRDVVAQVTAPLGGPSTLEGAQITGSPLHPALVHVPIGGVFAAALLDACGEEEAAAIATALAAACALPTAITGLASYAASASSTAGRRVLTAHAGVATIGTTLSLLSLAGRLTRHRGVAALALAGACAAYAAAGMIGGHAVYGDLPTDAEASSAQLNDDTTPIDLEQDDPS